MVELLTGVLAINILSGTFHTSTVATEPEETRGWMLAGWLTCWHPRQVHNTVFPTAYEMRLLAVNHISFNGEI